MACTLSMHKGVYYNMRLQRILVALATGIAAAAAGFGSAANAVPTSGPLASTQEPSPSSEGTSPPRPLTACGTEPVATFSYTWQGLTFNIPTGVFFTHCIYGSGLIGTDDYASIDRVGPGYYSGQFCNWRIDFKYYDINGKNYQTSAGTTQNSCNWLPDRRRRQSFQMKSGTACAILYVLNKERVRQCHNITP